MTKYLPKLSKIHSSYQIRAKKGVKKTRVLQSHNKFDETRVMKVSKFSKEQIILKINFKSSRIIESN